MNPPIGTTLSPQQLQAMQSVIPATTPVAVPPPSPTSPSEQPTAPLSVGQTLTPEQLAQLGTSTIPKSGPLGNYGDNVIENQTAGIEQVKSGIAQIKYGLSQGEITPAKSVADAIWNTVKGGGNIFSGAFNSAMGVINTASAPLSSAIQEAGQIPIPGTNKNVGDFSNEGIKMAGDFFGSSPILQKVTELYPNIVQDLGNTIGLAQLFLVPEGKNTIENSVNTAGDNISKNIIAPIDETRQFITDAIKTGKESFLPSTDPASIVKSRIDTLGQIENNNGPLRRVATDATNRGVDVRSLVANTDLLHDSVDDTGSINTIDKGGALDQFNEFMNKYESATSDALSKEGKAIPFSDAEKALNQMIADSRVAGGAKTRLTNLINDEINGLKLDARPDGMIDLSKLQDAKISANNGIDYTRPESKINQKMIANAYKRLIETHSSLPIENINADLSKYYKIGDYIEALNGKKVAGGKVGKYFAQTVGAVAGSHFGPIGSIIGAELAGKIKGTIMSQTFGQLIGKDLEASALLKKTVMDNKLPRTGLPAPAENVPNVTNNVPIEVGPGSSIEPQAKVVRIQDSPAGESLAQLVEKSKISDAEKTKLQNFLNEAYIPEDKLPVIEAGKKTTKKGAKLPIIK